MSECVVSEQLEKGWAIMQAEGIPQIARQTIKYDSQAKIIGCCALGAIRIALGNPEGSAFEDCPEINEPIEAFNMPRFSLAHFIFHINDADYQDGFELTKDKENNLMVSIPQIIEWLKAQGR